MQITLGCKLLRPIAVGILTILIASGVDATLAVATPVEYEIRLDVIYVVSVSFWPRPAPYPPDNVRVSQGSLDYTSSFSFFVDSSLLGGPPIPLSDIYNPVFGSGSLCVLENCYIGDRDSSAELFLHGRPHIEGLYAGVPCCAYEAIAFDGWFGMQNGYGWGYPVDILPSIPADLQDIGPNDFVREMTDYGYIGLLFGTYSISKVPEPSTLILLGVGVIGLAAWGRRKTA